MDNRQPTPRIQTALQGVFTFPAPDEAYLANLEKQLRAKLTASACGPGRGVSVTACS